MPWFREKAPIMREYVSDLDQFLEDFDKKPEAYSKSRIQEAKVYQGIGLLRDDPRAGNSDIFEDL